MNDLPDDEFRDIVDSLRLDLDTSAIETDERSDRYIRELARLLLTNPEAFDQLTPIPHGARSQGRPEAWWTSWTTPSRTGQTRTTQAGRPGHITR